MPNLVNFLRLNTARYYNLPTKRIICRSKLRYSLSGGDESVNLPVMTQPDWLPIADTKVDAHYRSLIPALQFSEPLV
jgi:hypothetical protein